MFSGVMVNICFFPPQDFLLPRYKGQVVIYNSVHAAGQAFVIPWGHTGKKYFSFSIFYHLSYSGATAAKSIIISAFWNLGFGLFKYYH